MLKPQCPPRYKNPSGRWPRSAEGRLGVGFQRVANLHHYDVFVECCEGNRNLRPELHAMHF